MGRLGLKAFAWGKGLQRPRRPRPVDTPGGIDRWISFEMGRLNAGLVVDKKSLLYLNGTVLEYDTSLLGKGFVFNNPNAKTTCGCGSSFGA